MQRSNQEWIVSPGRRQALRQLAAFAASSPLLHSQLDPFRDHSRVPKLDELLTPIDFEAVAHARLPRSAYDYTAYGSDGEFTLRRNRQAFDWVRLVPSYRALTAKPDTSITLFGYSLPFPILISPTAAHVQLHPDGELATHQGATAADATMIVSNVASNPIDKIAAAAKGPLWYQLYPREDMEANRDTLDRAQAAGCQAVVVTIDQQAAVFERALHGRHLAVGAGSPRRVSARASAAELPNPYRIPQNRLWYEWPALEKIKSILKVPMCVKGILSADDAQLALQHGADAIYVSNHGGRSLDYVPSTLEVLPEIVETVRGRVPVIFDSGVRRGTDVLKAMALGANAVCVGRLPRWGLGAYGAAGVQRILELLRAEMIEAMRVTGSANIAAIHRQMVRTDFP